MRVGIQSAPNWRYTGGKDIYGRTILLQQMDPDTEDHHRRYVWNVATLFRVVVHHCGEHVCMLEP